MFGALSTFARKREIRRLLAGRAQSRANGGSEASPYGKALCRALVFAAVCTSLILPLAIAARHSEAQLQAARAWPIEISATSPYGAIQLDRPASPKP
ncbi:hypothetical protein [Methylocella silvestris]|uniref:Uncharacterized protein n=1 Tax=Methylocella silvestris TaxID=199596 RepID=A0A2J7TKA7_METSI|nr:hypothetical protein [Methylocella silvestris]PNG27200.1 hypothetical protein CR492_03680 [Methylocella silvestris]